MPETAQPARETDEKKSRGLRSYVLWAFVAVMVYVLSIGPLALMEKKGMLNNPKLRYVLVQAYRPYHYVYANTPLGRPFGMYLHVWRPDKWDRRGDPIFE